MSDVNSKKGKLVVELGAERRQKLKIEACKRGITMTEYIKELVDKEINKNK